MNEQGRPSRRRRQRVSTAVNGVDIGDDDYDDDRSSNASSTTSSKLGQGVYGLLTDCFTVYPRKWASSGGLHNRQQQQQQQQAAAASQDRPATATHRTTTTGGGFTATKTVDVASTAAVDDGEKRCQRCRELEAHLEQDRYEFDTEKRQWLAEKNNVIEYQKRLQASQFNRVYSKPHDKKKVFFYSLKEANICPIQIKLIVLMKLAYKGCNCCTPLVV